MKYRIIAIFLALLTLDGCGGGGGGVAPPVTQSDAVQDGAATESALSESLAAATQVLVDHASISTPGDQPVALAASGGSTAGGMAALAFPASVDLTVESANITDPAGNPRYPNLSGTLRIHADGEVVDSWPTGTSTMAHHTVTVTADHVAYHDPASGATATLVSGTYTYVLDADYTYTSAQNWTASFDATLSVPSGTPLTLTVSRADGTTQSVSLFGTCDAHLALVRLNNTGAGGGTNRLTVDAHDDGTNGDGVTIDGVTGVDSSAPADSYTDWHFTINGSDQLVWNRRSALHAQWDFAPTGITVATTRSDQVFITFDGVTSGPFSAADLATSFQCTIDELPSALPPAEDLAPLTGTETRYLAFQIFEGNPDPAIPFDKVVAYTPKDMIAAMAHDIVTTIGVTGGQHTKLAVVIGPIAFDHTDAEARQIVDDGFAIATAENIAVAFHIDDSMFWSNRTDLTGDPDDVEWTDFSGTPSTGLFLDWATAPARMCFNAPKIQAEVTRRARDVIGAEIVSQLAILKSQGKEKLFAGVISGWESHMGQDVGTRSFVGFHALANRGFGSGHPPANVSDEIASIVAEFVGRWTDGLALAGIDPTRIYTHNAFLTKVQFATLPIPAGVTYQQVVDLGPSTARPSVAFAAKARPGFSTYPVPGTFAQIQEERSLHGEPGWASSEGTNLIPSGPAGNSNMTMETYLARCFNHGATLVDLYSWGIGGPSVKDTNAFRIVTEGPAALATYRTFLAQ